MKVVAINDLIQTIVSRVSAVVVASLKQVDPLITGVHFEYGHYTDIQERLITYSKTEKKHDRYPLVALFEDDRTAHTDGNFFGMANKKIIILTTSSNSWTRQQREERTFRPILYPIYEELLRQIWLSGYFNVWQPEQIRHDQINRPHWGDPKLYGNDGYLFTDILDGIELNNLQLQTHFATCS